jgi:Ferritin-like
MQVPRQEHDLGWLREGLQAAIELEFATVPVYLCALWSIKSQSGPVYGSIRGIVIDEMFHMGLACNMLTTVGGTPQVNSEDAVPKYPGPLPGGVRPWLRVALIGLTKEVVEETYMQIEYPEGGPIAFFRGETYPTIGEFYDAILAAFKKLQASQITGARQITSGQSLFAINTVADAEKAIDRIKRQGEGTSQSPFSDDFGTKLAHYYRFAEIFHGRKLIKTAGGKWKYEGAPVPFPEVFPMAEVPAAGYPDEPQAREFDRSFTTMLDHLQRAWADGNGDELGNAIGVMFELAGPARELMQKPRPAGGGNFGPDFKLTTA